MLTKAPKTKHEQLVAPAQSFWWAVWSRAQVGYFASKISSSCASSNATRRKELAQTASGFRDRAID
jgi:hypothetical protein